MSRNKFGVIIRGGLLIAILVIFIIVDNCIKSGVIKEYIRVPAEYCGVLFGALCTVSTLGSAVLSISVSSFEAKIYGFTVKEIINESSNSINVISVVALSMASIIIGLIAYANGLPSTCTAVLIYIIGMISFEIIRTWRLLTSERYADSIIAAIRESYKNQRSELYRRWFPELKAAILCGDEIAQDHYISLIKETVKIESDEDYGSAISSYLKDVFPDAYLRLGFVNAYKKIVCLNDWKMHSIDALVVVKDQIERLSFCDDHEIENYSIPGTIEDIIERMDLEVGTKTFFSTAFYQALCENTFIDVKTKEGIKTRTILNLLGMSSHGQSDVTMRVLLSIVRMDYIENEDVNARNIFIKCLILSLRIKQWRIEESFYISFLAQVFRAVVFSSVLEVETLEPSYREGLIKSFQYQFPTKDLNSDSLAGMVLENGPKIASWLVSHAEISSWDDALFDYFPSHSRMKNVVWGTKNGVQFAFIFHLMIGYENNALVPFREAIEDGAKSLESRLEICGQTLSLYNNEEIQLNESAKYWIESIERVTGIHANIYEELVHDYFDYFNQKIIELGEAQITIYEPPVDREILNESLRQKLLSVEPFSLLESVDLKENDRVSFVPVIRRRVPDEEARSAELYFRAVLNYLNKRATEQMDSLTVFFGLKSVRALLQKLQSDDYKYGNYYYVNDLAFLTKKDILESPEYVELRQLFEKQISFESGWKHLKSHVFLKQADIPFNAEVTKYTVESLDEIQARNYLQKFKISDNKYQIDGSVFEYESAMKYLQKTYVIENCEMRIAVQVNVSDGFVLKLDRHFEELAVEKA